MEHEDNSLCMFCLQAHNDKDRPFLPKEPGQHARNCAASLCTECIANAAVRHYIDYYREGELQKKLCQGDSRAKDILKHYFKSEMSCINCFCSYRLAVKWLRKKGVWAPMLDTVKKQLASWQKDPGVQKLCGLAEELSGEAANAREQCEALEMAVASQKKKCDQETRKRKLVETSLSNSRVELQLRERQMKLQTEAFMMKMARYY